MSESPAEDSLVPPRSDHIRLKLLARIQRQYDTLTQHLSVGGLNLQFSRVADPDRVLNEMAADADRRERLTGCREQDPLHLPYWAELWDSALGVGQWLVQTSTGDLAPDLMPTQAAPSTILDPRSSLCVLDLGCGLGLCGTVAAALGARVTFADVESPPLLFARLNGLAFDPKGDRIRTHQLNWRTDRLAERFDLILGADILYERKEWDHLEPFWRAHLAAAGRVVLGEPGRPTGDDFAAWAQIRGWTVETFEEVIPTRPKPIRVFRLRQT